MLRQNPLYPTHFIIWNSSLSNPCLSSTHGHVREVDGSSPVGTNCYNECRKLTPSGDGLGVRGRKYQVWATDGVFGSRVKG